MTKHQHAPVWRFWNPYSGFFGGTIFAAIIVVAVSFFAAWVLKL